MMRLGALACFGLLLSVSAFAKGNPIEKVFRKNKVKLQKTEVVDGTTIYHVKLPFDPSVGRNTNHLEAEIAATNGCRPFTLVSSLDKLKIHVATRNSGDSCDLEETLETLE